MSFNVSNFKQNVDYYGYIKNNKFEVYVQVPKFMSGKTMRLDNKLIPVRQIGNLLKYRIEQVRTPSVSLISVDTNRYGIGPTQKMPFNAQFFDTTFSILLDRNTDLWDFWYNWTNAIFNFNGQEQNGNAIFKGGRIPSYTVEYKDEYASNMMIVIYDDRGRMVKTINLYEAFPSSIREVQLAWNDNINLMRLQITVTYSSYSFTGNSLQINSSKTNAPDADGVIDTGAAFDAQVGSGEPPYSSAGFGIPAISPTIVTREN